MKLKVLLLVALAIGCCNAECAYKYDNHTMCKYTTDQGPSCTDKVVVPLTKDDQDGIIAQHNKWRQLIASGNQPPQPGARNMFVMAWDDELATVAQRWVDQCTFMHDENRDLYNGDKTIPVGQSIDIFASTKSNKPMNYTAYILDWFMEQNNPVKHVSFDPTTNLAPYVFSETTGHYTQLVWADSFKVGCGLSHFSSSLNGKTFYNYLFACNYAPRGNYEGTGVNLYYPVKALQKEKSGDLCEQQLDTVYDALCPSPDIDKARDIPDKYLL